ncbi:LuxR C-terminal-related transcriptional regulator [Christensenellaceae bacterium OttesenSCG-928-K19]|nr:LuxR C-terminal-related transcriptional regulator [Christensenellaceae bacterium OttesenSCG-928-K19]
MKTPGVTIQRKRLMRLAEESAPYKILYVQAPAGYGKTIFAGHWLNSSGTLSAMVSLDEYDNSIGDCCRKLKNALTVLYPGNKAIRAYTDHPAFDSAPAEFLMRAVDVMPQDDPTSLVIDDLHFVTDPKVLLFLPVFLMRVPAKTKVLILSRIAPPETFSGLYLKNNLRLVPPEQMRFDGDEIYALYKKNEIPITKKQAEAIMKYTEGWPIEINALLLSGNSMLTQNMPHEQLESFIKTQVWKNWSKQFRDFMVQTSIEEELTAGLCEAITHEENSKAILEVLLSESAFLWKQNNGTYHFHQLFREFLLKLFARQSQECQKAQWRRAGEWYLGQKDFFRAVDRFVKIKDYDNIAKCFDLLEDMDRAGFDTERIMRTVQSSLDDNITDQYPFLLYMLAFTARNEGQADVFAQYADKYYANYPRIVQRNPELAHNIFFLYALDFRYTLADLINTVDSMQAAALSHGGIEVRGVRGSATSYLPLYHRSFRDFSELALDDIDTATAVVDQILGALLGEEREMLIECIRAGLHYEKGALLKAHNLALSANAKIKKGFAPESKFCAMMLLATVNYAMWQFDKAETTYENIRKMIEEEKAFYLDFNLDAAVCKSCLDYGEMAAAQQWLDKNGTDIYDNLSFFRLCGHFSTARAHIALGNFDKAVILLSKLSALCQAYKRPIDAIEAEILLAIAFWKRKRGYQKEAMAHLEKAIKAAQPYGYTQVFTNEGAELENMLARLRNRVIRKDYKGDIPETFVKMLHIRVAEQAQHTKGLTAGRIEQSIKFTKQQKRVMSLLCAGYSYRRIGEALGIKFSTVRSHIELIYKKLDVSGEKEAILKIRELNILGNEDAP